MTSTQDRAVFGWQGITVTVPASWEASTLDGDFHEGYARLDDMDAIRFELKWNRVKGNPDGGSLRDKLLADLLRRNRSLSSSVEAEPVKGLKAVPDAGFFRWRGEVAALGMVTKCDRCGRALLGQVLFPNGREKRGEALAVLRSLKEHGPDESFLWSLYGFSAELDSRWKLASWKLSPGYLELFFERAGGERLRLRRWGPAEEILAGCDLGEWHERVVLSQYGGALEREAGEAEGHQALMVRRERTRGLLGGMVARLSSPRAAWTHWNLRSLTWHCPQSNRIHLWEHASRGPLRACDWRVHCHGGRQK